MAVVMVTPAENRPWARPLWEVDVDVLLLIEVGLDAQLHCPAADIGEAARADSLHHVAQVSGELHLAGPGDYVGLGLQKGAPLRRSGQAVDEPTWFQAVSFSGWNFQGTELLRIVSVTWACLYSSETIPYLRFRALSSRSSTRTPGLQVLRDNEAPGWHRQ